MKKISVLFLSLVLTMTGCAPEASEPSEAEPAPVPEAGESIDPLTPQPLSERTTLVVSAVANLEGFTPLYLANVLGEFDKENIDIEMVSLPANEAVPALALGQIDVSALGITASLFNLVSDGIDVRLVYPGPSSADGDGLWMSTEWLDASPGGELVPRIVAPTGPFLGYVPIFEWLEKQGLGPSDVTIEHLPLSEVATALEQGVYDGAWLNAPTFVPFLEDGSAKLVAEYPDGQTGMGYAFGQRLLVDEPEIGEAFIRALLRTQTTYLKPGYKSDSELVSTLADILGRTPDQLLQSSELTFLTEFDTSLYDQGQEVWLEVGGIVNYDNPLPASAFIDTRILDAMTAAIANSLPN